MRMLVKGDLKEQELEIDHLDIWTSGQQAKGVEEDEGTWAAPVTGGKARTDPAWGQAVAGPG